MRDEILVSHSPLIRQREVDVCTSDCEWVSSHFIFDRQVRTCPDECKRKVDGVETLFHVNALRFLHV